MLPFVPLLLALSVGQDVPKRPADPDDEVVAGLPSGDPSPLPERVEWELAKSVVAKTATRARLDLSGYWRFEAVEEKDSPVKRNEMGWISMPGPRMDPTSSVFDARFRAADGIWRGKPIEKFPYFWVERDITITNAAVLQWLNRRVFLVLRGPWASAEIYMSQRVATETPEAGAHVHVESVNGTPREGSLYCEVTEQLIYPGTTQISLRMQREAKPGAELLEASMADPYLGIELVPPGPRIESTQLTRDLDHGQFVARIDLIRPKGFVLFPGPPVRTIPMSLKLRLEQKDSGKTVADLDQYIGPITENERSVTMRVDCDAASESAASGPLKLRVALHQAGGRVFDEAFPIEFLPSELKRD